MDEIWCFSIETVEKWVAADKVGNGLPFAGQRLDSGLCCPPVETNASGECVLHATVCLCPYGTFNHMPNANRILEY